MKPFKAAIRAFALACIGLASLSAARAEDIVVTHYGSLLYGVPYAIALEKGYFKEAGVDITGILTSKGGGTSVRNMMAGDTLFAEVALPAALSAIKEGFNIKIISGGTDGSGPEEPSPPVPVTLNHGLATCAARGAGVPSPAGSVLRHPERAARHHRPPCPRSAECRCRS